MKQGPFGFGRRSGEAAYGYVLLPSGCMVGSPAHNGKLH